jgi:hypothetical protein
MRFTELSAAMGGNMSIGVKGKAMDTCPTRTAQGGALAFVAKARANPADSLTSTFTKGKTLLHQRDGEKCAQQLGETKRTSQTSRA